MIIKYRFVMSTIDIEDIIFEFKSYDFHFLFLFSLARKRTECFFFLLLSVWWTIKKKKKLSPFRKRGKGRGERDWDSSSVVAVQRAIEIEIEIHTTEKKSSRRWDLGLLSFASVSSSTVSPRIATAFPDSFLGVTAFSRKLTLYQVRIDIFVSFHFS